MHIIRASSSDREYPSTGSDSFKLGEEGVSRRVQPAALIALADQSVARFGTTSTMVWRAQTRRRSLHALHDASALLAGMGLRVNVDLYFRVVRLKPCYNAVLPRGFPWLGFSPSA